MAALADGPKTGVEILQAIEADGPRGAILGPGTFYRVLRDLREEGLIARTGAAPNSGDGREREHVLTKAGRDTLDTELRQLRRTLAVVSWARLGSGR